MRLDWNRNFSTIDGDAAGRRYYQDGKFYDGAGAILAGALPTSAVQYANLPEATPANFGLIMPIRDWGFPNALVQSNGAGSWVQLTIPRCTWGARLAASAWNGWRIHCSDLGADFFSNGADWYPSGGSLVLSADDFVDETNPQLGVISTTSQTWAKIVGWSLNIPGGLFSGIGSMLTIDFSCARTQNINNQYAYLGITPFDINNSTILTPIAFTNNSNIGSGRTIISRLSANKVTGKVGSSTGATNVAINTTSSISSFNQAITWDEAAAGTLFAVGQVTATANDRIYLRKVKVILEKVP